MFYGLLDLPVIGYVVFTLVMIHLTNIAITLFLHRAMAHRALTLHPIVSHWARLQLWMTTGIVTKEWTAIHRKHHARCETEEDPHSPQILGLGTILMYGSELYRREGRNPETLARYGAGTPDDWMERNVYTKHSRLGILTMFIINLVLLGVPGIMVWCLQMLWSPVAAAGVVNGIGHFWGYRNFECPDAARNISPIGILLCGEELHNNHHTFGTSAKFSVMPWEFDIGWMYISLLSYVGLAKANRIPPQMVYQAEKAAIDMETVKALFTNRFQLMAHYAKEVIVPVFKQSASRLDLSSRVKKLMIAEACLVDAQGKQQLQKALDSCQDMKTVYEYKQRLQDIWAHTTATQKELLEAVQTWCKEAEATGIAALQNFASRIRSVATA